MLTCVECVYNKRFILVVYLVQKIKLMREGNLNLYHQIRELIELHRYMGVSNQHYDTFKKHLYTILQDMGHTQDLIQLVMEKIEEQR